MLKIERSFETLESVGVKRGWEAPSYYVTDVFRQNTYWKARPLVLVHEALPGF
jgi:hypothetical protein